MNIFYSFFKYYAEKEVLDIYETGLKYHIYTFFEYLIIAFIITGFFNLLGLNLNLANITSNTFFENTQTSSPPISTLLTSGENLFTLIFLFLAIIFMSSTALKRKFFKHKTYYAKDLLLKRYSPEETAKILKNKNYAIVKPKKHLGETEPTIKVGKIHGRIEFTVPKKILITALIIFWPILIGLFIYAALN